jgi:uncharacterized membrane protein YphA (DoxX/SURF4 family)
MTSIYLFLLGRILLGGYFLNSGWAHFKNFKSMAGYARSMGVPAPELAVGGTGVLLAAGGLSILTGFWVQLGIASLIVFFLGVTFKMHAFWKIQDQQQMWMQRMLFMRNIALTGAVLMLLSIPQPWAWSLMF